MSPTISFAASATTSKASYSAYTRPNKKPKMSITQTYFLAHSARGKLSKEAARADHDLRLLVGHANMLDSLMIDLANAEQEQEKWFNQSVRGATPQEEEEEDEEEESSPEDLAMDETETEWEVAVEETETTDDESDDEYSGELTLSRTKSHQHSPPELTIDSESDSEDEQMPSSPPDEIVSILSEKERQAIATTSYYESKEASLSTTEAETFQEEGYYIPSRSQPITIAAY